MKKKFIAVYALIGVLALGSTALTSCVDDNESASVTAIRDAKAAQLNAYAAYYNAQAEAQKITSEAQAAIDNAEAAYQELQNQMQEIELQKAQAALAGELAVIQIEAEANLQRAQANLESAKAQLIASLDQVSDAEKTRIEQLIIKADGVLGELNTAQKDLITKQSDLIAAQYGLKNDTITTNQTIADKNLEIAIQQALIAEYEKHGQDDKATAEQAAAEAAAKAQDLYSTLSLATTKNNQATTAADAAYQKVMNSEFMQNVVRFYLTDDTPESEEYIIDFGDGTTGPGSIYYDQKWVIDEEKVAELDQDITNANRQLDVAEARLTEANKALTDLLASDGYKAAQKAVTDAQAAYDKATTEAEKIAALGTLQSAEDALERYADSEEAAVESAQTTVDNQKDNIESLNKTKKYLTADNEAYKTYLSLYDEYAKAEQATKDVNIAYQQANHNYTVQSTLAQSLQDIATATADYTDLIAECNKAINTLQGEIEALNDIQTQAQLVAYLEAQIAQLKDVEIPQLQAEYDEYMAQIKNLIENGSQLPELPTTDAPATDTPAEEAPAE